MLDLLAFVVVAVGLATPFVVPLMWGQLENPESARTPRAAFDYWDKGTMATIGRSAAVAKIGQLEFSGFLAWLAWLCVHLVFLVGFRNKVFVLFQWAYSYFTYKRGGRIITGLSEPRSVSPQR